MRVRPPSVVRALVLSFAMLLPAALVLGPGGAQPQRSARPPARAAQIRPKNLQVLRGMPPRQLLSTMRTVAASLGVRCGFCHAIGPNNTGYEKDTKPEKRTARRMIVMVANINRREKVLDRKATCYMCHHGRPQPQTSPPGMPAPRGGGREGRERD